MSLSKKYLATKPECKVTFKLDQPAANGFSEVYLVGDFNNWDRLANPMKKLKGGEFSVTLNLETGKEYQYKYFADQAKWINDPEPDKLTTNEFQGQNCVICL
ncbi:MAG: isoamylase early set domain-containing protein [Bacteroidota bacterium]|nr:MAG: isoamylase early set domain-containing protein [Bacteroidota bacterium]